MNANWCKRYSKLLLSILLRTNKKLKKKKSQKTPFHSSLFENWLNKILVCNCHLKEQLMEPKANFLPKPTPKNHHHWNLKKHIPNSFISIH